MINSRELYAPELWQQLHEQWPEQYPACTADELKYIRSLEIRRKYALEMDALVKPYLQTERETWFTQLKEADEWMYNPVAPTPMLSAIAEKRGISLSNLVNKVKENDTLFRSAVGDILGRQQAELDALYAE